jgi:predicted RNase H-like nuclease (RuvC/YqgF family)
MKFLKKKIVWTVIGAAIVLLITYGIGTSTAKVDLGKEKVTHDDILQRINDKKEELESLTQKVGKKESETRAKIIDLENQLTGKEKEVNDSLELVKQKDSISAEIVKLKGDVSNLSETIKAKQKELNSLDTKIKAKKEAPISLGAGTYIVGKDVKAGRYKVVPVGRGSNFFVLDSSGVPTVNTILGNDGFGVPDYVFSTEAGETIESHAPVKLIPVE